MKTTTSYIARSKNGNAVASFDTYEKALEFQSQRGFKGVGVKVWKAVTTETELVGEMA